MKPSKIILISMFLTFNLNGMDRSPRWYQERWEQERQEVEKIIRAVEALDKKRREEAINRERQTKRDRQKPKDDQ